MDILTIKEQCSQDVHWEPMSHWQWEIPHFYVEVVFLSDS